MFAFAYLWVFWLLPLPWLLRRVAPPRAAASLALRVPFGERLAEATGRSGDHGEADSTARGWAIPVALWLLMLAAVARPQWIAPPVTQELPTRDLLLLVDLSGSMDQKDFTNKAGVKVDRLVAVKEVLSEFLARRQGDRVGLVVFGDAPYLQAPFSTDLSLSERLLGECAVGMAGPRTALGDAIGLGVGLFDHSEAPAKTMIALTDGNDTKSRVPPVEAARIAAQRDIRIYAVAIGDPTTAGEDKLDEQALRDVADAAGGSYFYAADRQGLESIYQQLDTLETRQVKTVSHRPQIDLYYVPLALALVLSLGGKLVTALSLGRASSAVAGQRTIRVNAATGKLEVHA